jgi:hypothetical protein
MPYKVNRKPDHLTSARPPSVSHIAIAAMILRSLVEYFCSRLARKQLTSVLEAIRQIAHATSAALPTPTPLAKMTKMQTGIVIAK